MLPRKHKTLYYRASVEGGREEHHQRGNVFPQVIFSSSPLSTYSAINMSNI